MIVYTFISIDKIRQLKKKKKKKKKGNLRLNYER